MESIGADLRQSPVVEGRNQTARKRSTVGYCAPMALPDRRGLLNNCGTMAQPIRIRSATKADTPALLSIYRPIVETSATSFEIEAPSISEFSARIEKALAGWQWLVAEQEGQCIGYAYGSAHRERPAYRWSVEVSAYVRPDRHRLGVGRTLYLRLFDELAQKGFCHAYAGITLPNDASVALHRRVGFEPIGIFKSVGRKFAKWHDVAWFQRTLRDSPPPD
jgi:L-amino acid N-acyltransferase YncA